MNRKDNQIQFDLQDDFVIMRFPIDTEFIFSKDSEEDKEFLSELIQSFVFARTELLFNIKKTKENKDWFSYSSPLPKCDLEIQYYRATEDEPEEVIFTFGFDPFITIRWFGNYDEIESALNEMCEIHDDIYGEKPRKK